jgi:hypothetical protein
MKQQLILRTRRQLRLKMLLIEVDSHKSVISHMILRTRLSPTSSVTTLSELSQSPSLDFNDTDEDDDANSALDCILFEQPLNALPGWEMIDNLKARYFANVFPGKVFPDQQDFLCLPDPSSAPG